MLRRRPSTVDISMFYLLQAESLVTLGDEEVRRLNHRLAIESKDFEQKKRVYLAKLLRQEEDIARLQVRPVYMYIYMVYVTV